MTTAEKHHLIATVIEGFDCRVCECPECIAVGRKDLCFFNKDGWRFEYDDLNYSKDLNLCARAEEKLMGFFAENAYLEKLQDTVGYDVAYYEVTTNDTLKLVFAGPQARVEALVEAAEQIVQDRKPRPRWTLIDVNDPEKGWVLVRPEEKEK